MARPLRPIAGRAEPDIGRRPGFEPQGGGKILETVAVAGAAAKRVDAVAALPAEPCADPDIAHPHRIAAKDTRAVEAAIFALADETGAAERIGGLGRDKIFGGPGNDSIAANGDAARDTVSCGKGKDVVDADPGDSAARDCEVVHR